MEAQALEALPVDLLRNLCKLQNLPVDPACTTKETFVATLCGGTNSSAKLPTREQLTKLKKPDLIILANYVKGKTKIYKLTKNQIVDIFYPSEQAAGGDTTPRAAAARAASPRSTEDRPPNASQQTPVASGTSTDAMQVDKMDTVAAVETEQPVAPKRRRSQPASAQGPATKKSKSKPREENDGKKTPRNAAKKGVEAEVNKTPKAADKKEMGEKAVTHIDLLTNSSISLAQDPAMPAVDATPPPTIKDNAGADVPSYAVEGNMVTTMPPSAVQVDTMAVEQAAALKENAATDVPLRVVESDSAATVPLAVVKDNALPGVPSPVVEDNAAANTPSTAVTGGPVPDVSSPVVDGGAGADARPLAATCDAVPEMLAFGHDAICGPALTYARTVPISAQTSASRHEGACASTSDVRAPSHTDVLSTPAENAGVGWNPPPVIRRIAAAKARLVAAVHQGANGPSGAAEKAALHPSDATSAPSGASASTHGATSGGDAALQSVPAVPLTSEEEKASETTLRKLREIHQRQLEEQAKKSNKPLSLQQEMQRQRTLQQKQQSLLLQQQLQQQQFPRPRAEEGWNSWKTDGTLPQLLAWGQVNATNEWSQGGGARPTNDWSQGGGGQNKTSEWERHAEWDSGIKSRHPAETWPKQPQQPPPLAKQPAPIPLLPHMPQPPPEMRRIPTGPPHVVPLQMPPQPPEMPRMPVPLRMMPTQMPVAPPVLPVVSPVPLVKSAGMPPGPHPGTQLVPPSGMPPVPPVGMLPVPPSGIPPMPSVGMPSVAPVGMPVPLVGMPVPPVGMPLPEPRAMVALQQTTVSPVKPVPMKRDALALMSEREMDVSAINNIGNMVAPLFQAASHMFIPAQGVASLKTVSAVLDVVMLEGFHNPQFNGDYHLIDAARVQGRATLWRRPNLDVFLHSYPPFAAAMALSFRNDYGNAMGLNHNPPAYLLKSTQVWMEKVVIGDIKSITVKGFTKTALDGEYSQITNPQSKDKYFASSVQGNPVFWKEDRSFFLYCQVDHLSRPAIAGKRDLKDAISGDRPAFAYVDSDSGWQEHNGRGWQSMPRIKVAIKWRNDMI